MKKIQVDEQQTLQGHTMNDEQVGIVCKSINTYTPGGHPLADAATLPFFRLEFAIGMVEIARDYEQPVGDALTALQAMRKGTPA